MPNDKDTESKKRQDEEEVEERTARSSAAIPNVAFSRTSLKE
jgi:hypothetical protein